MLSAGLHHHHGPTLPAVSASPMQSTVYTGPIYHGIDYNATWPNWTSIKPDLTHAKYVNSKTIQFKSNIPLVTNQFVGAHLYDVTSNYYFAKSTISSMTSDSLTITGPDEFRRDVDGHHLVIATDQLSDSDFANSSFQGLWGTVGGRGRNDLQTIANGGYNLVRLYNWGPSRGWKDSSGSGDAHLGFLNTAGSLGLKVMVPVSNYFLGNAGGAWHGDNPNSHYSWDSAPRAIRDALLNFISSITVNGAISPVVQSISVGNELDLGIDHDPGNTAKLERAMWWVVNLHNELVKKFGPSAPHPLLTIPVSNADQDSNGSNLSWFEAFIDGVKRGQMMPNGSVPGGTFDRAVAGLDAYPWYTSWFFNSYQTYKDGTDLTQLLQQYDTGGTSGGSWSEQWPGQKFDVPLMLTEIGISRLTAGSEANQFNVVANQQAQVMENVLQSGPTNFMGYCIFEFNDEPNKNNVTQSSPFSEALFGIFKYYATQNLNDFRNGGTIMYSLQTGETKVREANPDRTVTWSNLQYPVYQLYPVESSTGQSLYSALKTIMAEK